MVMIQTKKWDSLRYKEVHLKSDCLEKETYYGEIEDYVMY